MDRLSQDIKRQAKELAEFLAKEALDIIEVENINHIEQAFDDEGFTNSSLQKWRKRSTRGQRYKTDRRGKKGQLTAAGRADKGRAVLTGQATGGNKLRNSFRAERQPDGVRFKTDKDYAERHNEGQAGMPKRTFVGKSKTLSKKVMTKIEKGIDKILDK